MRNELERITKLFEEKKISKEEYTQLIATLEAKPNQNIVHSIMNAEILVRLQTWQSLTIGILIIVALSFLSPMAGFHFPGFFDYQAGFFSEQKYLYPFIENLISILIGCIFFFLAAIGLKIKGARIVDILATLSYARLPYLILTILLALSFSKTDASFTEFATSPIVIVGVVACLVWLIFLHYKAFKISVGKTHWAIFVILLFMIESTTAYVINKALPRTQQKIKVTKLITEKDKVELIQLADTWNNYLSNDEFEKSLTLADDNFNETLSVEQWQTAVESVRKQIGRIVLRNLVKIEESQTDKKYINLIYESTSENGDEVEERIVCIKNKEGKWQVAGNWVK